MQISAVRRGTQVGLPDEEARLRRFERTFRLEYARVVAVANRVLADGHAAEDVAQEVFLKLYSAVAEPHNPSAWLHATAANAALNRMRSERRREKRELRSALDPSTGGGSEAGDPQLLAQASATRERVRAALRRLPRRGAAVLAMRYAGLSYAEVAGAMGVRVGQVGTMLRRAEQALRREVTNEASE